MSSRAIILGIALGLSISLTTYYNDFVIRQSSLINHLLPISVIGFVLLLVLVVNPVMQAVRPVWVLRGREVGVITLIGLAACTWPGAGFFRTSTTNLVMPGNQYPREPSWTSKELMTYLPGGSPRLGHGHVADWPAVIAFVVSGQSETGHPTAQALWSHLNESERRLFTNASQSEDYDEDLMLRSVNRVITQGGLVGYEGQSHEAQALASRLALVDALPESIRPPPKGSGVLFEDGRLTDATDQVVLGPTSGQSVGLGDISWERWAAPARLWALTALLLGGAVLCMALIVHPQWSSKELLPYPIARFVTEMTRRDEGGGLPTVARQRVFWGAAVCVFAWHLIGGLHVWFPGVPELPRRIMLSPLSSLFPDASRVPDIQAYLQPVFYPTVIALAFLLNRSVSFSMGIAPLCYVLVATAMIKRGDILLGEYLGAGASNMLRFGAWAAMAGVIAYTGRRYYANLACAAAGLARPEVPRTQVWAARALVALTFLSAYVLTTGGLSWHFAFIMVLLILLMFLVLARIVAETGMFYIQPYWMPVAVLIGLFGFEVIGPTTYLVAAIASVMLVGDVRTALLGNLVNGLKIAQDTGEKQPRRLTPWIILMLVLGFVASAVVTLYIQYNHGLGGTDMFTRKILPAMPFEQLTAHLNEANLVGSLANASAMDGRLNLGDAYLSPSLYGWMIAGALLLIGVFVIRLRASWWPLHPVIFLVWGTFPANRFAASFLVGWLIKSAVMALGGTKVYRQVMPLMLGLVVGDLAAAFLWIAVGAIYYLATGQTPASYMVF